MHVRRQRIRAMQRPAGGEVTIDSAHWNISFPAPYATSSLLKRRQFFSFLLFSLFFPFLSFYFSLLFFFLCFSFFSPLCPLLSKYGLELIPREENDKYRYMKTESSNPRKRQIILPRPADSAAVCPDAHWKQAPRPSHLVFFIIIKELPHSWIGRYTM